ncbi:Neurochondrin [Arabidopsis thaliana x Arabidopsis arenosa]|uniref:Neurochondrin n=1 Tax=Arabidopsis thaliana x Arabidopsis arenosa TaxID=1240361 RepID=A0A8T1Y2Y2_9BRAS|nr:Neurochondrin [Arabidopsis thaliana x Arabidopsis arenosa]
MAAPQEERSPSLDDCLKLLKGERDEQRLAGLLLVTKFCKNDDIVSLKKVYDAVGTHFLDRLLRTGTGSGDGVENRDVYLQLSVTVLAALCRVPEIASSVDMVSRIPLILEIMSKGITTNMLEDCYELLYLVSTASEAGVMTLINSGGLRVIAPQISDLPDGSHAMEVAIKILQLLVSKLDGESMNIERFLELSLVVAAVARQFAVLHNALKFEALHLLSAVFSSEYSALLHEPLRSMPDNNWADYMRTGVVAILQNRVAPSEKLHALILAENMMSILGEKWLIGRVKLPNVDLPADRCLLLVLESSHVEISVLLNDLAYKKYEAPKNNSTAEDILLKQRYLPIMFSLVEKIIKYISSVGENEGTLSDEAIFQKVIKILNETVGVVLEYLKDAKEHGNKKGNDLLLSVRVIGSYLAETPVACKEQVQDLLDYMLSVEGEDESSPVLSTCFLLPFLCQITMKAEGCKLLAYSRGDIAVVECVIKLIERSAESVDDDGSIFLACDTIMNILLKREQISLTLEIATFSSLLKALAYWADRSNDNSVVMMAASICSLIFDLTSEDALLKQPNFNSSYLDSLARLIARSLSSCGQDMSDTADLLEIITAGYSRWADRFPTIKKHTR